MLIRVLSLFTFYLSVFSNDRNTDTSVPRARGTKIIDVDSKKETHFTTETTPWLFEG